jgi:O-antigen/teichoic acid export membrane protein
MAEERENTYVTDPADDGTFDAPALTGSNTTSSTGAQQSGFARNVFQLVSGAAAAQLLAVLLIPVFSRLFAPEAFGTAALFAAIVSIAGVIVCLRYELAIMLPGSNEEAAALLISSLIIACAITTAAAIAVWLFGPLVARWLNAPGLIPFLWLIPVAILATGINLALSYWISRRKRFRRLSAARVAASAGTNGVKLGTGLAGYLGSGGLIAGFVAGPIISSTLLAQQIWRDDSSVLQGVHRTTIISSLKRYRRFPLLSTWSALLNVISVRSPTFALSFFFSQQVVGYYAMGVRVIQMPMALIGSAVAQVFFQRASEADRQGLLGPLVSDTYQRLVALGLFPMLVFSLIGQEIFVIILGPEWSEAGVYAQIMSLWRFLVFVGSPMSTVPSVLERQDVDLFFNIGLLATRLASLILGGAVGNARIALALYAGSGFLMWMGLVIWVLCASGALVHQALLRSARYLLYSIPPLGLVAVAKWWWDWPAWAILGVAVAGALPYYAIVISKDPVLRNAGLAVLQRVGR